MNKVKQEELIEELSKLTVLQMAELKTALEEKWGVKAAAAAVAVAPAGGGGGEAAAVEESTDFQITLVAVPADKKIAVIKVVREVTGLGLKEAKELVDGAPKVLKESAPKAEASDIKAKIEAAGGKAELKGL
ncbi:MAG: 50S ribosomal protein L7/L12 [Parachlamydiales bacterium]